MGSVVLPHLTTGWHVDQAIMSEDERLVVIRFGRDWDPDCMRQDEVLYRIADRVKNFAVIYLCDIDQVKDFSQMYELYDRNTIMFFFRNKHMMCDFGEFANLQCGIGRKVVGANGLNRDGKQQQDELGA